MEYKYFDSIKLKLPEIGFGTFKYLGGVVPIRKAIELGACFIDTAEGYRGTEKVVGKAIKGIRDQVIISDKVLPIHFRYKDIIKAADNSLKRLKTDYIDIYQLHWPNPEVPIFESMQAMESLIDVGKIRFIGVSNFTLAQLKQANNSMAKHRIHFTQVNYSLIERNMENDLLPYCVDNDIMIIAYSPLGGNLHSIKSRDKQNALKSVSEETGKTQAQIALNWCISKKNVIAITKTNLVSRVKENCDASGWRLSSKNIELLENSINGTSTFKLKLRNMKRKLLVSMGLEVPIHKNPFR